MITCSVCTDGLKTEYPQLVIASEGIKIMKHRSKTLMQQGDHKPEKSGEKPGVLGNLYEHGKLRKCCTTSEKIFNKQNSFSLIRYLCNTTRSSWASYKQSLVNLRDGHSALMTCHIAGVDVE